MVIIENEMVQIVPIYDYLRVMQWKLLYKLEIIIHEGCQSRNPHGALFLEHCNREKKIQMKLELKFEQTLKKKKYATMTNLDIISIQYRALYKI